MKNINKEISNRYEAPLVVVLFLIILFFIWGNIIFVKIAFLVGFISLLSKQVANFIGQAWKRILRIIGFVNSHVLLSLVFILVLIPLSFLYRLSKKDPLNLKGGKESYYVERNHQYEPKDFEKPW